MKTKALTLLLVLSLLANLWLALRMRESENSKILALGTAGTAFDDSMALSTAEELAFLRDLLERWFSFQSASYLSGQVGLLPLLSGELAETRKKEAQRLSRKMQNSKVEQKNSLRLIRQEADGSFQSFQELTLAEDGKVTSFRVLNRIEIEKTDRSIENAWGLLAKKMSTEIGRPLETFKNVPLAPATYAQLSFPCPVRDVSDVDAKLMRLKLVTTRTSDLTLIPAADWNTPLALQVRCEDKEFSFTLMPDRKSIRYYQVPITDGKTILKMTNQNPERNWIKRSLEKELGFQVEESGK